MNKNISNKKFEKIAETLYSIAHSGITGNINFIEKVCKKNIKNHTDFNKDIRNKIGLEFMFLFLHITSRMVINILGENKAWELMKKQESIFLFHMTSSVKNITQEAQKELELSLGLRINERQLEYANYKAFAENDEGLKDTLFFEFGKHICEVTGYPKDIRLIIAACSGAFAFVKGVDWKDILKKIA